VYFGTKSARVTPKALAQLKQLAKCNPGKQIELIGHTDERGDEASNLRLSEMRAKSVARQLERAGIASGQIKFSGKGEAEPAQTGKGPAVWAKNRRVEVRLL
jgi:outer membrane protein OmpA-like peptidoglycan-associated protein